jgi:hypothetical protein
MRGGERRPRYGIQRTITRLERRLAFAPETEDTDQQAARGIGLETAGLQLGV